MDRSSAGVIGGGRDEEPTSSSPRRNSSFRQLAARAHLHGHGHHHGTSEDPAPPPGSPLLLDDDPYPMHVHGQGMLVNLIRKRSLTSLHHSSAQRGRRTGFSLGDEDVEASPGVVDGPFIDRPSSGLMSAELNPEERRLSAVLLGQNVRSMRLIGNSNPRYRWARYWKTEEELREMKKPIRQYYERTNFLVQQYLYIDRLLDSSLPHDLLNEYNNMPASHFRGGIEVPATITEVEERDVQSQKSPPKVLERSNGNSQMSYGSVGTPGASAPTSPQLEARIASSNNNSGTSLNTAGTRKVKRTPKDIYRPRETTPLFNNDDDEEDEDFLGPPGGDGDPLLDPETGECRRRKKLKPEVPWLDEEDEDVDSGHRIVTVAIYINFMANAILLAGKIAVIISVPSMSVLASLVDAVLDFLSTVIVWTTTWMISHPDQYRYPVGRRRLEPLGVLVFSIIMITSFVQVALECAQRLISSDHSVIQLGIPAIAIMIGTILIKGAVWLWCRLVKNSSVQALAEDAKTDIIFNTGSIIFPIAGFYWRIWWLDALGGLLLSVVVIVNWSKTSAQHIKNLCGFSATADQRNVLLYLTMRFAKTIKQIQGLQAYHVGDKLNVEVDIVLDASTPLRDSHDLAESLGYVLEAVPIIDRAFVHCDYASWNLPTHMDQQSH